MTPRSLTFRCLSFTKWLYDDLRTWRLVLRHPLTYIRWYRADQRPKLGAERRMWIVAPAIGQVYVALRFAEELRRRRPGLKFLFSVQAGSTYSVATREAHPDDLVTYLPTPLSIILWRAFRLVRPSSCVAVISRGPIYFYSRARKLGTPVAWIAAESTDTQVRKMRAFWSRFDSQRFVDAVDVVATNTPADRDRLIALGFDPRRIEVTGPAKYDAALPIDRRTRAAASLLACAGIDQARPVLVGGSLYDGESEVLLDLYLDLKPRMETLGLVLAPININLAASVARASEQRGLRTVTRSQAVAKAKAANANANDYANANASADGSNTPITPEPADVVVLDTTGDLTAMYGRATVVFVGRSLTHSSGSNLMEAAGHGKPIVVGPKFEHFREVLDDFLAADAVCQVADAAELRSVITKLLDDPERREAYGRRAFEVVARNTGSLRRTADYLERAWLRP